MIVQDNLEFHAAELRPAPNGVHLLRVPQSVGAQLTERARWVSRDSIGCEIRFVTDAPMFRISLSCYAPEFGHDTHDVKVMCGDFEVDSLRLREGVVSSFRLSPPAMLKNLTDAMRRRGSGIGFAPNVWRLISDRSGLIYCDIDTFGAAIRPPRPEEKPARTVLCYGSSITNSHLEGYPFIMSRSLGLDMVNLGYSGACAMEPAIADWIVDEAQWDIVTYELGINVLWCYDAEQFRTRAEYLIRRTVETHPDKPVFLMPIFPCAEEQSRRRDQAPFGDRFTAFTAILRELYETYRTRGNLHWFDGDRVFSDYSLVRGDGVHPTAAGHALMGFNLAGLMRPILN